MRAFLRAAAIALCLFASQVQAAETRIVGGQTALPGAYPFIVAIAHNTSGSLFDRQFCGGALINSRWVVTAAHCMYSNGSAVAPASILAYVGAYDLNLSPGETHAVEQIIVHPNYNAATSDYDIALVKLSTASAQSPIWLYSPFLGSGVSTRIIGWGGTVAKSPSDTSPNSYPTTLREATVPTVSNSTCNAPASYNGTITSNMLCAGYGLGGVDSCQGDSGGPLLVYDNGSWTLGGVVSFGDGCAWPNYYGIYTRISSISSFITTYVPAPLPEISMPPESSGGVWGLWNSNLNMYSIAELVNNTGSAKTAQVYSTYADGTVFSKVDIPLAPYQQYDLVINSLPYFQANSYGSVRVLGGVSGRIFSYRPRGSTFDNFDYAFGIPMDTPQTGTKDVTFNTYQPSNAPGDLGLPVANWLSLVNPTSTTASFQVYRYNQAGTFLGVSSHTVAPWSRTDVQGGHEDPGPNNVGLLRIVPADPSKGYLAQLVRYGYQNDGNFSFAFPLVPSGGTSSPVYASLSTMLNAENWLEVMNSSASSTTVTIRTYASTGALLDTTARALAAREQYHYPAYLYLGASNVGHAEITSSGGALIAQSMHYSRTPSTGGIEAAYAISARSGVSGTSTGSYNLFLNMYDFLKVINTSSSTVTYDLTVSGSSGSGSSATLSLAPHSSTDLGLHESQYGTVPDSYGTAVIQPQGGAALGGTVIRFRYNASGLPEFIAPTELR